MEHVQPFYIGPSQNSQGNVARIRGLTGQFCGTLELNVISGGPVFLWRGRKEIAEAYNLTHGGGEPDFELGASANGNATVEVEGGLELMTLHSDTETIGFVKLTTKDDKNETADQLRELLTVLRNGIRIPHEVSHDAIPVDPGAPRLAPERGHMAH